MTVLDLRRLHLRPGEIRREELDVELEPFVLGGQRYEPSPSLVPATLDITHASGANVFELEAHTHLAGPCMRCLGFAELEIDVRGRELHDPEAPPGDELRSDYVADERLEISRWLRDALALALPDQILCRTDCAGLCPMCGKDLNLEPHEHAEHDTDPRWAALEQLRDEL